MSTFFDKARERAQAAAAQFGSHGQQGASADDATSSSQSGGLGSFTYTGGLPHMLRHGVASVDPRYEYNRSFHQLSGKIKSVGIDHEALARETKAMGTATYRWGQDQLAGKREDGVCDEALADVSDRLAYMFSLIGDLHSEHAKRLEASRVDFKRIQKVEAELAPRRQARVKIHRELHKLLPERAKGHSELIEKYEGQLKQLEQDDKALEDELSKLKREALRSSYDSHFDSIAELGEKVAVVARHGKLLLTQLPVYAPPFPAPRVQHRAESETKWEGEAQVAAIKAGVQPALHEHKTNLGMPPLPQVASSSALSRAGTEKYAESHKEEIASLTDQEKRDSGAGMSTDAGKARRPSMNKSLLSPSLESESGGNLPERINMEPAVIPPHDRRRSSALSPPTLPPRPGHEGVHPEDSYANESALADDESGPTLAETGSPIASGGDPGPLTGVLSARPKGPPSEKMPMPPPPPGVSSPSGASSATVPIPVPGSLPQGASARLRRDGTIVRRGDADWAKAEQEQLPPYEE